ncbi:MAG: hypothetical protein ACI89L_002489, partial [Phycisphaerales bacterium]
MIARAEGPGGPCRLRVFEVPAGLGPRPDLAVDLLRFLESGGLQATAAERSPEWVPVLAKGRDGGKAFIATEPGGEPMQGLVDRKAHLSADDLESIVRGVIAGLRAYHAATDRAMGSLSLGTV